MTIEEWRRIPGASDYEVSDLGRVRSHRRRGAPLILKPATDTGGYRGVCISMDSGAKSRVRVHSLVLLAFVGPRPEGMLVRHLNGESSDNRLSNLAYGTPTENNLDTVRYGGHFYAKRTHCAEGHEFTPENTIRRASGRRCRECSRVFWRERMRVRRAAAKAARESEVAS
jgi:hypothetical protein